MGNIRKGTFSDNAGSLIGSKCVISITSRVVHGQGRKPEDRLTANHEPGARNQDFHNTYHLFIRPNRKPITHNF